MNVKRTMQLTTTEQNAENMSDSDNDNNSGTEDGNNFCELQTVIN